MTSGFYYKKLEQINSRKLLNVLFKKVFHINDTTNAKIMHSLFSHCFPIIFMTSRVMKYITFFLSSDKSFSSSPTVDGHQKRTEIRLPLGAAEPPVGLVPVGFVSIVFCGDSKGARSEIEVRPK